MILYFETVVDTSCDSPDKRSFNQFTSHFVESISFIYGISLHFSTTISISKTNFSEVLGMSMIKVLKLR